MQSPSQQNTQKSGGITDQTLKSPNLLTPSAIREPLAEKAYPKITTSSKVITILVQAIFLLSLVLNAKFDSDIAKLQNKIAVLENKIAEKKVDENKAARIIEKIEKYKSIKTGRAKISSEVETLEKNNTPGLEIMYASIKDKELEVLARAASPLSFVKLTTQYFESNQIEEVVLESAVFNKFGNNFALGFKAKFK